MKLKYAVITLILGLNLSSAFSFEGKAVEGTIGLGGVLKSFLVPKTLPLGSMSSSYGYETWDITKIAPTHNGSNRVDYCTASMELETSATLLGLNFGADFTSIHTVGICDGEPDSLAGEELAFSLSYDAGKGTKSVPITASFRYSLAMQDLLDNLEEHFSNPYPVSFRKPHERLNRMYIHVLKYLARTAGSNVLSAPQRILLKTLFFPAAFMKGSSDVLKHFKFDKGEVDILKTLKDDSKVLSDSFSNFPTKPLNKIYRDPEFYKCGRSDDCDEIYLDFLTFKDLLSKAIVDGGYCHSVGIAVGLKTDLSVQIDDDFNFGFSYGYSSNAVDKVYKSSLPLGVLVGKRYALHNFVPKSNDCQAIEEKNAKNFARLLILMGHGK